MNLGELKEAAIGQVVPMTATEELVNSNREFVRLMVNKAYHRIERRALWKFSEGEAEVSAVSGTKVCPDVPADMAIPLGIWSNKRKTNLVYHDERQRFLFRDDVGPVECYGLWEDDLLWYPTPKENESFRLRYYKSWADLVDNSDEPIIPEVWQSLLIDFASGQLARRLPPAGDRFLPHSKAQPWIEDFEVSLEEMANSDLVMKTWDEVPNYEFQEEVLSLGEW